MTRRTIYASVYLRSAGNLGSRFEPSMRPNKVLFAVNRALARFQSDPEGLVLVSFLEEIQGDI